MLFKIDSNILITTSRKPSQITRRFAQFLKHFLQSTYINRGKTSFNKLINMTNNEGYNKLVIITETKGNPSAITVYDTAVSQKNPIYSIYINVSLPKGNSTIKTNDEIVVNNKASAFSEFNSLFEAFKPVEKVKSNCIVITDEYDNSNSIALASFIDQNEEKLRYKIYITGFDINVRSDSSE